MSTVKDKHNRAYLKLSEIDDRTVVEADGGFSCLQPQSKHLVHKDEHGFFIFCADGKHYLQGQADDGEHCIGLYKV